MHPRPRSSRCTRRQRSRHAAGRRARMHVDCSIFCTGSTWTPRLGIQLGGLGPDPPCASPQRTCSSGVGSEEARTGVPLGSSCPALQSGLRSIASDCAPTSVLGPGELPHLVHLSPFVMTHHFFTFKKLFELPFQKKKEK